MKNAETIYGENGTKIIVHPATEDSIGEWGGREADAIDAYNRIVFPALVVYATECAAEQDGENDYSHYAGRVWDKFCSDGGEDFDARAHAALVVA